MESLVIEEEGFFEEFKIQVTTITLILLLGHLLVTGRIINFR